MLDRVIIQSAQDSATLELFDLTVRSYNARLHGCAFEGTVRVDTYEPAGCLAAFLHGLAADWRGWQGERRWRSLEDELSLTATSDSTGHIYLRVRLRSGPSYDWSIRGMLLIEAGQLEGVAGRVQQFMTDAKA